LRLRLKRGMMRSQCMAVMEKPMSAVVLTTTCW